MRRAYGAASVPRLHPGVLGRTCHRTRRRDTPDMKPCMRVGLRAALQRSSSGPSTGLPSLQSCFAFNSARGCGWRRRACSVTPPMAPRAAAATTIMAKAPAPRPGRRPWRKRRPPRRWPGAVEPTDDDDSSYESDGGDAGGGAKPPATAAGHTASPALGLAHAGSASSSPRAAGSALGTPHGDLPDGRTASGGGGGSGIRQPGSPGQLPTAATKATPHGAPTSDRRLSLPSALGGDLPNGATPAGSPGEAARRALLHRDASADGHSSPPLPAADDAASPPRPPLPPPPPFTLPPWWREAALPPRKLPWRPARRHHPAPPLEALTPGQWVAALDRALAQFRPAQVVRPGRFGCTVRFLRPPRSLVRVLDRRQLVVSSAAEADRHIALPPSQPVLARMADGYVRLPTHRTGWLDGWSGGLTLVLPSAGTDARTCG